MVRNVTALIVFYLIGVHLFSDIDKESFHVDEVGWFSAGYDYYQLMFVRFDFDFDKWKNPQHRTYGWMNLPVGKYFIGLALDIALPRGEYLYKYDFSKSATQNLKDGNIPRMNLLYPGRLMSAIFAFGSCLLMFWFAMKSWNWLVGIAASLVLAYNPLFTKYAHIVMSDVYLIFFFLALMVTLNTIFTKRYAKNKTFILLCCFYGVLVGLCTSVKLNGGLGIIYLSILFIYLWSIGIKNKNHTVLFYAAVFCLSLLCTIVTMILINPYFYTSSPRILYERGLSVITSWGKLLRDQTVMFPQNAISPFSVQFIQRIVSHYIHWIFSAFALIGLGKILYDFVKDRVGKKMSININALIVFLVNTIGIGVWISLDWDRYYLPIIITVIPIAAYGIYVILSLIFPPISRFILTRQN